MFRIEKITREEFPDGLPIWMGLCYFTHLFIYISAYMQFKELEIKPQGSRLGRLIRRPQTRRTLIAVFTGAAIGFAFFYLTERRVMESIPANDIVKSLLVGGFFGFFITNSPCARGRC